MTLKTSLDLSKVSQKLRVIEKALEHLYELQNTSKKDFLSDFRNFDSAKYNLQTAIEAMVDICNHIISRTIRDIPMSNADSFRILCDNGILSQSDKLTYANMARFRNRIVHMYDEVNNEEVYNIVIGRLGDFEKFIQDILAYIQTTVDS